MTSKLCKNKLNIQFNVYSYFCKKGDLNKNKFVKKNHLINNKVVRKQNVNEGLNLILFYGELMILKFMYFGCGEFTVVINCI